MMRDRKLLNDWYPGTIPKNVVIDPTAYIGSSYNFVRFRSKLPIGAVIGYGASLDASTLDVGPRGKVIIEDYAMITQAYVLCDIEVSIGAYSMVAWNAVLIDNYRMRTDHRRLIGNSSGAGGPIRLGRNTWIGFEACVLPGVTIGEGSIVGARSVVTEDVLPYVVVAGNPARMIRKLPARSASTSFRSPNEVIG
jgi:acetyltransferase-like isoleucine patch superfamily enzyme